MLKYHKECYCKLCNSLVLSDAHPSNGFMNKFCRNYDIKIYKILILIKISKFLKKKRRMI